MLETTAMANRAAGIETASAIIPAALAVVSDSGELMDHAVRAAIWLNTLEMIHAAHQKPISVEFSDAPTR